MFFFIEIMDLGQHQGTAILAAPPVASGEPLGKYAKDAGT
jgi:hypothetical protein